MMIKNKKKTFEELVQENKQALLNDKQALEKIEKVIENRYIERENLLSSAK